jgi:hypothetical protein
MNLVNQVNPVNRIDRINTLHTINANLRAHCVTAVRFTTMTQSDAETA